MGEQTARLPASSARGRDNNFAILHFIGALMVIYGHQHALLGGSPPAWLGNSVSTLGVKMIFVITGFLITQSYLRDCRLGRYLLRRLIRIYPALIACVVGTTLLLSAVSTLPLGSYFRWSLRYVADNILLRPYYALPGVFETNLYPNAVNGSLWTMPVEVSMYFVVGGMLFVLLHLFPRSAEGRIPKLAKILYAVFVLAVCGLDLYIKFSGRSYTLGFWGTDWISALDVAPYILLGSLFCLTELNQYCNLQVAFVILVLGSCVNIRFAEAITMIVVPYCVLSFSLSEKPVFRNWFRKNNIAYGVYLWGFPIQQLVLFILQQHLDVLTPNRAFAISMLPILLLGWLSHHLVERPIEGRLKKLLIRS